MNALFANRHRLFWVLNVAGWAGYLLAAWLGALAHEKPESYFSVLLVAAAGGFAATIPLRALYRRLWARLQWQLAAAALASCYALALGWQWLKNKVYFDLVKDAWQPQHLSDHVAGVLGSFYILLCWSGLYIGIRYYQQFQQQTEATLQATAAAHQAQLRMLRYQLNPHFLFNTLNAISTLILDGANVTANRAVTRLSDFLRYTLENDPEKRVTLGSELHALDLYLEIEKVRFGDRLTVERAIEPAALVALVPSLILQPLIENAIKYAISPSEDGGTLTIGARVQDDELVLEVADSGPGLDAGAAPGRQKKSCGVGLANTRERLRQLYGEAQTFTLAPNEPRGLAVRLRLPFQPAGTDDT